MQPLQVCGRYFRDCEGRSVLLRGINVSGDSKLPRQPDVPSHNSKDFWELDKISFIGRPFELAEADTHLARIASWGYNVIRFVLTWESVEHAGPSVYDEEYISYIIEILKKCGQHNLYVIMDPHQDVWSRFSGGSGAPYWTFLAAGINPRAFAATEAAIVHNTSDMGNDFPKMIWSTNYERMAAATMFVLFFAGRFFAPKAVLNEQNIQDYLQSHFINAMAHIARRIHEDESLAKGIVVGWESMNEPSMSWIGCQDLGVIPSSQHLRKGTCPTPFQAIVTASGQMQTIEVWDFKATGPRRIGSRKVDPQGQSIWSTSTKDDETYAWRRADSWQLGSCIWEQHGVWDSAQGLLLRPAYFATGPDGKTLDDTAYLTHFWMQHFRLFKASLRSVHPSTIMFCQPPVLKVPPVFDEIDRKDTQIVYSPHFYDGLTLMNKTWNTWYNVDVLGVLRGRYRSPIFAVKFGLRAIRNCLKAQLCAIRQEGLENLGEYPCVFSEIGIPFDMDEKKAYVSGDYSSQIGALDANCFALEGANVGFTFWHYSALNNHLWGDFWNGEDLSFCSRTKQEEHLDSLQAVTRASPADDYGLRAAMAFLRPAPISICGDVEAHAFDLKTCTFSVTVRCMDATLMDRIPSLFFVPRYHFRSPKFQVNAGEIDFDTTSQLLSWWHDSEYVEKEMKLTITESIEVGMERSFIC